MTDLFDPARWFRPCSRCGTLHSRSHRYCGPCHNAYMRAWRRTHRLSPGQRRKDNARSHANIALRRRQLYREPCNTCGSAESEMHHPDYDRHLEIIWLCRQCHLETHRTAPEP